ncbi:SpoIIE family protein phosphatase [Sansalvadorimonas sp. 2012CJ34-2]|uniref:SpoIIE family protein phosphatase n=1 Tax=Parendozoicomonas callyspongiae TaxID=2942213 RepID=A0ABT0PEK2_9GAMM|nr:SpoIIE family protein phosphatase [Sansalvadorimonas sp. 2012CJ34-2]MCL6269808.1 SpoIIE family protein phosphatase [Sansalvadorimonas sp. 2012CJ34-2]
MDVLIVEDARDQLHLLSAIVRKLGHKVHQAMDGLEALSILEAEPEIRIVVSDWMMPNMDGIALCESIRNGRFDRYIYFILLTGQTDHDALVRGLSVGADDFLHKPVDYKELEVRLKGGGRVVALEQSLEQKNMELSQALLTVEKDLESAASTQEALLAQPAVINGVGFEWHFQPSKILGGDMFGYHAVDDEHVMFYQLDVAGHGIPSALFSFALNNLLMDADGRTSMLREELSKPPWYRVLAPHEVVAKLNQRFQASADSMLYFTMIYGVVHTPSGRVTMTHAGHPATFWVRPQTGDIQMLADSGVPVGMMPNMSWETREIQLKPGDRLFMYSDGMTECESPGEEQFGEPRLQELLHESRELPMTEMIEQVWKELCAWRGQSSFDDDMTCLVLEYQGGK